MGAVSKASHTLGVNKGRRGEPLIAASRNTHVTAVCVLCAVVTMLTWSTPTVPQALHRPARAARTAHLAQPSQFVQPTAHVEHSYCAMKLFIWLAGTGASIQSSSCWCVTTHTSGLDSA